MMDRNSRRKWYASVVIVTTLTVGFACCICHGTSLGSTSSHSSPATTSRSTVLSLSRRHDEHDARRQPRYYYSLPGSNQKKARRIQTEENQLVQPTQRFMDEWVLKEQQQQRALLPMRGGGRRSIKEFVTELNVLKLSSYIMMSMGIVVKLCTDTMLEYLCGFTEDNITYGLRVFFSWSGSYMLSYGILVYKLLIEPTSMPSDDPEDEGMSSSVVRRQNAIGSAMLPLLIEMLTGLINGNPSKLGYHPLVNYVWSILYGVVMYSCFQQTTWCDICLKIMSILMLLTSSLLAFGPETYLSFYGMTSYGVPPMLAESIFFVAKSNGYFGLMIGWLLFALSSWGKLTKFVLKTNTILMCSWMPLVGYTIDGLWIGKQTKTLHLHCCTYMMGLISQIVVIFLPTMARILADKFENEALFEEEVVS